MMDQSTIPGLYDDGGGGGGGGTSQAPPISEQELEKMARAIQPHIFRNGFDPEKAQEMFTQFKKMPMDAQVLGIFIRMRKFKELGGLLKGLSEEGGEKLASTLGVLLTLAAKETPRVRIHVLNCIIHNVDHPDAQAVVDQAKSVLQDPNTLAQIKKPKSSKSEKLRKKRELNRTRRMKKNK